MTKEIAPKTQVKTVFEAKGADAAREKAKELGIANHRVVRWIEREWPAKAAPKADAKAPKATKTAALKTAKKAPAKKMPAANRTPKQTPASATAA